MKILYWSETFQPTIGGVEVLSLPFIHAMQEEGFEFGVVTSHCELDARNQSFQGEIINRELLRVSLASIRRQRSQKT